jgi:hypothetical protein
MSNSRLLVTAAAVVDPAEVLYADARTIVFRNGVVVRPHDLRLDPFREFVAALAAHSAASPANASDANGTTATKRPARS